jgi:transcription elongation factor SPT5
MPWDLLTTSSSTVGVIVKIEGALLRILDQNGGVRVISPSQVTPRRENKNFVTATDAQGNDMKVGDQMKEVEGEVRSSYLMW